MKTWKQHLMSVVTLTAYALLCAAWLLAFDAQATPNSDLSVAQVRTGGKSEAKRAPTEVPRININTASEEQWQQLPGIGPAKAERIVAWRTKNGPFRRIADLRRVKGIGHKTLKRLEPYLTLGVDGPVKK